VAPPPPKSFRMVPVGELEPFRRSDYPGHIEFRWGPLTPIPTFPSGLSPSAAPMTGRVPVARTASSTPATAATQTGVVVNAGSRPAPGRSGGGWLDLAVEPPGPYEAAVKHPSRRLEPWVVPKRPLGADCLAGSPSRKTTSPVSDNPRVASVARARGRRSAPGRERRRRSRAEVIGRTHRGTRLKVPCGTGWRRDCMIGPTGHRTAVEVAMRPHGQLPGLRQAGWGRASRSAF